MPSVYRSAGMKWDVRSARFPVHVWSSAYVAVCVASGICETATEDDVSVLRKPRQEDVDGLGDATGFHQLTKALIARCVWWRAFSGTVRRAFQTRGHEGVVGRSGCQPRTPARFHSRRCAGRHRARPGSTRAHPPARIWPCLEHAGLLKAPNRLEAIWRSCGPCWRRPSRISASKNPVSIIASRIAQRIRPFSRGSSATGNEGHLSLAQNLPKLRPTQIVAGRSADSQGMAQGQDRWKERSRSYFRDVEAMAAQWSTTWTGLS